MPTASWAAVPAASATNRRGRRETTSASGRAEAGLLGRPAAGRPAAGRLVRGRTLGERWDLADGPASRGERQRSPEVGDLECLALLELVARLPLRHLDLEAPAADEDAKDEPLEACRQAWCEGEHPAAVAHAPEAGDDRDPGTGKRCDVHAVAGVLLQVVQIHQRGLAEVVVGELEVTDLGGDDGLGAGGERRVAHGQPFVVGEVARLLLGCERVAAY